MKPWLYLVKKEIKYIKYIDWKLIDLKTKFAKKLNY